MEEEERAAGDLILLRAAGGKRSYCAPRAKFLLGSGSVHGAGGRAEGRAEVHHEGGNGGGMKYAV